MYLYPLYDKVDPNIEILSLDNIKEMFKGVLYSIEESEGLGLII